MVIKNNKGNEITVKAVKRILDHEGLQIVDNANIYFNGKKIGYYQENYNCGPSRIEYDEKYKKEIDEIAENFLKIYPNGIDNKKYKFSLKELYEDNLIELLCIELCKLEDWRKSALKTFKKGYKYFVISRKSDRHYDEKWSIPTDMLLTEHKRDNICVFIAKDEDSFNIYV